MSTTAKNVERDYRELDSIARFDALARLARAMTKYVKPINMTIGLESNNAMFSFSYSVSGMEYFDIPTKSFKKIEGFSVPINVKVELLEGMSIKVFIPELEGMLSGMQKALLGSVVSDIEKVLESVDLSPRTRTAKVKEE